jgi:hypothetical protein
VHHSDWFASPNFMVNDLPGRTPPVPACPAMAFQTQMNLRHLFPRNCEVPQKIAGTIWYCGKEWVLLIVVLFEFVLGIRSNTTDPIL